MTALWVALGAGLGGMVRLALSSRFDHLLRAGTLTANTVGCFILGLAVGRGVSDAVAAFVAIGFCGALTTWSAMAAHTVDEGPRRGALLALVTVLLAVGAVWLGHVVAS